MKEYDSESLTLEKLDMLKARAFIIEDEIREIRLRLNDNISMNDAELCEKSSEYENLWIDIAKIEALRTRFDAAESEAEDAQEATDASKRDKTHSQTG